MTADRMRAIDRHLGVPLCFLATILVHLFANRAPPEATPKKILFMELSEMGSTILVDPAMQKARRLWGAELFFVIFADRRGSLDFLRTVPEANIVTLRVDSLWSLAVDTVKFLLWTRRHRIDTLVDLELFSRFTALLTGLSGAVRRVGFYRFHNEGLYRGEMLTHRVAYNPHIHIAKNFIALINALASPEAEIPYSKTLIPDAEIALTPITLPETALAEMTSLIRGVIPDFFPGRQRLVLINPNASEMLPQRRWPPGHFAELARLMLARWPDLTLLVTGSPDERDEADALVRAVADPRVKSFAGCCRLGQLPALYSLAALMVTNDSGPAHFASVTSLPTIVLFGPETPALYGALGNSVSITAGLACSPCVSAANHRKTACSRPVCMTAIGPDRVFHVAESILDRASHR